ncbi:hypothetical protein EH165_03905 [Nakamurella antarctica]|uniref:Uncharacterized protein n=2 Tax=Nakamurella antarctica TaxID=1902245 RepID=A0A3G8ZUN4_9ACTN|nr:hypothetical protein EH165_03905 [Nakamurella antarctica]
MFEYKNTFNGDNRYEVLPEFFELETKLSMWRNLEKQLGPGASEPPFVDNDGYQVFCIGGLAYRIGTSEDRLNLSTQEPDRGTLAVAGRFNRRFEIGKYLVWKAGESLRAAAGVTRVSAPWFSQGVNGLVESVDDGYVKTIFLQGQEESACTFAYMEAIRFSHVMPMSMPELEDVLRAGLPHA